MHFDDFQHDINKLTAELDDNDGADDDDVRAQFYRAVDGLFHGLADIFCRFDDLDDGGADAPTVDGGADPASHRH